VADVLARDAAEHQVGLLYGVILCNARAMGEFGAVYVVSSRRAEQITLPLRIERVYYETVTTVVPVFAVRRSWPCSHWSRWR
jgi:ABC-type sulfate transport system permease subunit